MKIRILILSLFTFFFTSITPVYAAKTVDQVFGTLTPPASIRVLTEQGGSGGLSLFLTWFIEIIYIFAAIIFLFMVIFSAVQWITSGGDKEAVSKARSRLTYAIIGITLLALSFFIARIVGQVTGFNFFVGQELIQNTPADNSTPFELPVNTRTLQDENARQACNLLANRGYSWNDFSKQCDPPN
jgi:hypothetical protein